MPFAAAGLATAGTAVDYGIDPIRGETMWQLSFPFAVITKPYWGRSGILLDNSVKSRKGVWLDGSSPDFHTLKL